MRQREGHVPELSRANPPLPWDAFIAFDGPSTTSDPLGTSDSEKEKCEIDHDSLSGTVLTTARPRPFHLSARMMPSVMSTEHVTFAILYHPLGGGGGGLGDSLIRLYHRHPSAHPSQCIVAAALPAQHQSMVQARCVSVSNLSDPHAPVLLSGQELLRDSSQAPKDGWQRWTA